MTSSWSWQVLLQNLHAAFNNTGVSKDAVFLGNKPTYYNFILTIAFAIKKPETETSSPKLRMHILVLASTF